MMKKMSQEADSRPMMRYDWCYDRSYIYESSGKLHDHGSARGTTRSPVMPTLMWHRYLLPLVPTGAEYTAIRYIIFAILLP